MKDNLIRLGKFVALSAWTIGSIGGFFALMYYGEHPLAIAMLATIGMSLPTVKNWGRDLLW